MQEFIKKHLLTVQEKINNRRISKDWFEENGFLDQYEEISKSFPDQPQFSEKIHCILNGDYYRCDCGKVVIQRRQFCSQRCTGKSEERNKKRQATAVKNGSWEKRKDTMKNRYGVESNFHMKSIQDKVKNTVKEKYGVNCISQLSDTKEKIKNTLKEKYGIDHLMQCPDFRQRAKETRQTTAMTETREQKIIKLKKFFEYLDISKITDEQLVRLPKSKKITQEFIDSVIGGFVDVGVFNNWSRGHRYKVIHAFGESEKLTGGISLKHQELIDFLISLNVEFLINDRTIITPKELDIFIPSIDLAIEINGTYWHNEFQVDKNYHLNKTKLCQDKNIILIHVFDWYSLDKIKDIIRNKLGLSKKIAARKCTIKQVSTAVEKKFLNAYHLQDYCASTLCYGLYFENELVQVMSFRKPRFSKHEWEIVRLCSKEGISVVGGASKLFNHFLKETAAKNVVSYALLSLGGAHVYEHLGFSYDGISSPNYMWTDKNCSMFLSRYQAQKKRLLGLLGDNFIPCLSEVKNLHRVNFSRIFDCGNEVWVYNHENVGIK